jgi:hypothetical protein
MLFIFHNFLPATVLTAIGSTLTAGTDGTPRVSHLAGFICKQNQQRYEISKCTTLRHHAEGWKEIRGATTAPSGYVWIYNGKSIFSKEYRHALLKTIN